MNNVDNFNEFIKAAAEYFVNYEIHQHVTHTYRYVIDGTQVYSGYEVHKYSFFGVVLDKDKIVSALDTYNITKSDTISVTWCLYNDGTNAVSIEFVA